MMIILYEKITELLLLLYNNKISNFHIHHICGSCCHFYSYLHSGKYLSKLETVWWKVLPNWFELTQNDPAPISFSKAVCFKMRMFKWLKSWCCCCYFQFNSISVLIDANIVLYFTKTISFLSHCDIISHFENHITSVAHTYPYCTYCRSVAL